MKLTWYSDHLRTQISTSPTHCYTPHHFNEINLGKNKHMKRTELQQRKMLIFYTKLLLFLLNLSKIIMYIIYIYNTRKKYNNNYNISHKNRYI